MEDALRYAFEYSHSHRVIVEEFIEKQGCSSDSDCFSVDGELKFVSFSAQYFDENAQNPYTPAAYSWPSTMTKEQEAELTSELQRLLSLLKMKTSVYNVETRVGTNGKTYIMEVSPRGGGNRLSEMVRFATGIDLITNAVRAAIGDSVIGLKQKQYNGFWAEIILHSDKNGVFEGINIDEHLRSKIHEIDLWVKEGDKVSTFKAANNSIGTLVLNFETHAELLSILKQNKSWIKTL